MTRSDIYQAIDEFLLLIEQGKPSVEEAEEALPKLLDQLALAYHFAETAFDNNDYPDPPDDDFTALYKILGKRFPNYGYYHTCEFSEPTKPEASYMGDAIDDIADITRELRDVHWRWKNTSEADALWHFRFMFQSHWGRHLRELQLYLYSRNHCG
jgi:hypothetical protein